MVIEEDGKTEEEFIADLIGLKEQLVVLGEKTIELEDVIASNTRKIVGE